MKTELKGLTHHHTALARYYISRKNHEGVLEVYNGRFGKGYKLYTPNRASTHATAMYRIMSRGR